MRRYLVLIVLFCLTGILGSVLQSLAEAESMEYKVKAAFLFNFAKFLSWPRSSAEQEPFVFCVVGEDPFGAALDGIEEKHVGGNPVRLVRATSLSEDLASCRLLFVAASERNRLAPIQRYADERNMVTVSDIEGFASHGGIIEFREGEGRLFFVINNTRAQENGIHVSSSLLSLAAAVL